MSQVQSQGAKTVTSGANSVPGSNIFGFVAQKKSIMRQHKDFLIQSSQKKSKPDAAPGEAQSSTLFQTEQSDIQSTKVMNSN